MSDEIRSYTCLVPAGTPATAPVSFDLTFPSREVDTLEIVIPPGPSGFVGFAVQNSGLTVIPYDSDSWIISSNEKIVWPLHGYINSGSWQIQAYNTGVNDHAIYVRFLLSLVGATASAPMVQPIDADLLSGSVG